MRTDIDVLARSTAPDHEHGWCIESSHRTLDGVLHYVRCGGCGVRRIDLSSTLAPVPAAASRVVGDATERTVHSGASAQRRLLDQLGRRP